MFPLSSLLAALALGATPDPDLASAESAFVEGRYETVLPAVHRALERPLQPAECRRAHELEAMTDAAFDDSVAAIEAFRRLLGVDPAYTPGPATSPKILGLVEEARRRGPLGAALSLQPTPAPQVAPITTAPEVKTPLTRRWWFWTGVAVVVAGAGAGGWLATHPAVPPGNLGTGTLR